MSAHFLTIRLNESEAELLARLGVAMGMTRTELVKRALRSPASESPGAGQGFFDLGAPRFGRHGAGDRQAAEIKRLVRIWLDAKRTG